MSEENVQKLICIGCPLGCHLEVEQLGDGAWKSEGYQCKKGKEYAVQEVTDPRRMVATTVAIEGARWARLPVRTAEPVPRALVADICRELHHIKVRAPIKMGDVVLHSALDPEIRIIATRSM